MEFAHELLLFMKARRKLWMMPVFILLFVFGALVLMTQGTVFAPFIYSIF
ncbi:DUF5989 family protein [Glacieibacterium sp.]